MKNILLINEKDIFHYYSFFSSLPALKAGTLEARFAFLHQFVGYGLYGDSFTNFECTESDKLYFFTSAKVLVIDSTTVCTTTVASFEKSQHFVLRFN